MQKRKCCFFAAASLVVLQYLLCYLRLLYHIMTSPAIFNHHILKKYSPVNQQAGAHADVPMRAKPECTLFGWRPRL
jgi:hypothetical protein